MSVAIVYHFTTKEIRRVEIDSLLLPVLRPDERCATISKAFYNMFSNVDDLIAAVPQLAS